MVQCPEGTSLDSNCGCSGDETPIPTNEIVAKLQRISTQQNFFLYNFYANEENSSPELLVYSLNYSSGETDLQNLTLVLNLPKSAEEIDFKVNDALSGQLTVEKGFNAEATDNIELTLTFTPSDGTTAFGSTQSVSLGTLSLKPTELGSFSNFINLSKSSATPNGFVEGLTLSVSSPEGSESDTIEVQQSLTASPEILASSYTPYRLRGLITNNNYKEVTFDSQIVEKINKDGSVELVERVASLHTPILSGGTTPLSGDLPSLAVGEKILIRFETNSSNNGNIQTLPESFEILITQELLNSINTSFFSANLETDSIETKVGQPTKVKVFVGNDNEGTRKIGLFSFNILLPRNQIDLSSVSFNLSLYLSDNNPNFDSGSLKFELQDPEADLDYYIVRAEASSATGMNFGQFFEIGEVVFKPNEQTGRLQVKTDSSQGIAFPVIGESLDTNKNVFNSEQSFINFEVSNTAPPPETNIADICTTIGNWQSDGKVDANDYYCFRSKYAISLEFDPNDEQMVRADLDQDGDVDAFDYVRLRLNYNLGL